LCAEMVDEFDKLSNLFVEQKTTRRRTQH
jgi:hypothetical protein